MGYERRGLDLDMTRWRGILDFWRRVTSQVLQQRAMYHIGYMIISDL